MGNWGVPHWQEDEMKYYDRVRLIRDSDYYRENQLKAGDEGEIIFPEIRDNTFYVRFEMGDEWGSYNFCDIKIEDLELVKVGWITNEDLKEEILITAGGARWKTDILRI